MQIQNYFYKDSQGIESKIKIRTIQLEEGMIWTIVKVGHFGYYDDLIYRMLRVVDEYSNVEYVKTKQVFTPQEFNTYIKERI